MSNSWSSHPSVSAWRVVELAMESTIVINLTVPVLRSSLDSSHSQGAFTGFTTNIGRGVVQITSNGARERYFHVISCPCLFCFSDLLVQGEIKKRSTVIQWSWTCLHPESKWYRIHFKSHPPSWHWWRASAVGPLTTQICVLYEDHRKQ